MNASGSKAGWLVNHMGPYGVNALRNDILTGHTAALDSNNLIVENIMMNDVRNGSDYRCVIISYNTSVQHILRESGPTLLYVAGEYQYVYVTESTKTGLICTKCTYSFYHMYLFFCLGSYTISVSFIEFLVY